MMPYRVTYACSDFGTERTLTVYNNAGDVIGKRDPFFNGGVPAQKRVRVRRIWDVASEIIDEYEANCKV